MTALTIRPLRRGIGHTISHELLPACAPWAVLACLWLAPGVALAQTTDRASRSDDPFVRGAWQLELSSHTAIETWNYNISHEEMYGSFAGLTYAVKDGIALSAGNSLYYVAQRGVDAWLMGATFGVRGRVYRRGRTSVFVGFEVGISESDTFVPPRGTRFNYLAVGSAGATVRLRTGVHLLGSIRWIHVSNNGLAGRQRNPDIEAVGPQIGILVGF